MAAPTITSGSSFSVTEGQTLSEQLTATGTPTITWANISGSSDPTISFTGLLEFTAPAYVGDESDIYAFTARASNGDGSDDQLITITVQEAISMQFTNPKYITKNGNDSTGDGSSGSPWLTLVKGISEALSDTSIDALLLGNGSYSENFNLNSIDDLFIGPITESDGTNVVIQNSLASGSDDRVISGNSSTDNIVFGRLTVDAESRDNCYRGPGTSTNSTFTFDGTRLINFTEAAVHNEGSTYFTGEYYIHTTVLDEVSAPFGVAFDPVANGKTLVMGGQGEIDITGGPSGSLTGVGVYPNAATDNHTVIIEDGLKIKITRDANNTAQNIGVAINALNQSVGFDEVYIGEIDYDTEGSSIPTGIVCNVDKSASHLTYDKLTIRKPNLKNNSFEALGIAGGGYGVNIGGEWDSSSDTIGEAVVTRLDYQGGVIDGFNHGEYFGGLTGHDLGYGTTIKNSRLSAIIEGCDQCNHFGRLVLSPENNAAADCLRVKDSTNCNQEHNTVIVTDTSFNGAGITEQDGSTAISTGNNIRNNNVIFPSGVDASAVLVDSDTSTLAQATYANNHYYKGGDSFTSDDFNDEGVDRDLSGWQTNVESTAVSDADHGTNLTTGALSSTSDLAGRGSTAAVAQRDFNGRFFNFRRSIGALELGSTAITGASSSTSTPGLINPNKLINSDTLIQAG